MKAVKSSFRALRWTDEHESVITAWLAEGKDDDRITTWAKDAFSKKRKSTPWMVDFLTEDDGVNDRLLQLMLRPFQDDEGEIPIEVYVEQFLALAPQGAQNVALYNAGKRYLDKKGFIAAASSVDLRPRDGAWDGGHRVG